MSTLFFMIFTTFLLILTFVFSIISFKTKSGSFMFYALLSFFVAVIPLSWNSVYTVDTGHVQIYTLLGEVQEKHNPEGGPYIENPFYESHQYDVRRFEVDFEPYEDDSRDSGNVALTSDGVELTIEGNFPIRLNGEHAWRVHQNIGRENSQEMLQNAAWTAVRNIVSNYTWVEATRTHREQLADEMGEEFRRLIRNDLTNFGISTDNTDSVYIMSDIRLRNVEPPERIKDEISEREAASVRLDRQETLTRIAEEEANRRQMEGEGISRMLSSIPNTEDVTPFEVARIIRANADKQRADALMKAVENSNVETMVLPSSTNVSVPTTSSLTSNN